MYFCLQFGMDNKGPFKYYIRKVKGRWGVRPHLLLLLVLFGSVINKNCDKIVENCDLKSCTELDNGGRQVWTKGNTRGTSYLHI